MTFPRGKGGRRLRLTTLPPSCANCLEIWEPQPSGALRAVQGLLYILDILLPVYKVTACTRLVGLSTANCEGFCEHSDERSSCLIGLDFFICWRIVWFVRKFPVAMYSQLRENI